MIQPGHSGSGHRASANPRRSDVYLVDGTYELFRHHFGQPSRVNSGGVEVAATRGVVSSLLGMLEGGVTHMGVATDHVIESFRNDMWPGYKTSAGVPAELLGQFDLLEEALGALGLVVWAMVELEADDALASAAAVLADDDVVGQVLICTPDKDLAQCVVGRRVVQLDRRKRSDPEGALVDEEGVVARFGVGPPSIPDYLALVGDSADGYPGLPGWGAKSASSVLSRYVHIENIPADAGSWGVPVRGALGLAGTLRDQRDLAVLFKDLATLRVDRGLLEAAGQLQWLGPNQELGEVSELLDMPNLVARAETLASRR